MGIMEKERVENVLSFLKTKNVDEREGQHICRGKKWRKKNMWRRIFLWSWKRFGERNHLISEGEEGRGS